MNDTGQNPIEYIGFMLELAKLPITKADHIEYDESTNVDDCDWYAEASATHDGTLLFSRILLERVLWSLIERQVNLKDGRPATITKYTVGNLLHNIERGHKVRDEFSGIRETWRVPLKIQYVTEDE